MQYNQDSKFWHFATLVADFILLNLLFIVLCIPVVTIGPAFSALIHTTLKLSEDENRTLIKPFWNEFKRDITKKISCNYCSFNYWSCNDDKVFQSD